MAPPAGFPLAPPALRDLVIIPTYNERENIEAVLERVLAVGDIDVLVVDDSSPDGTASLVAAHPEAGRRVHLLVRRNKSGLGPAYRAGFAWALDRGYRRIVQMDADLSHPPDRIPALLTALVHSDIAVGSRYVAGGAVRNWPLRRRAISWAGNLYVRWVLGLSVRDTTAGFKAYRNRALTVIDAVDSHSNGYSFQIENTWRAERRGLSVVEVPITFVDRTHGRSKMSGAIVVEAIVRVLRWRVDALVHRGNAPRSVSFGQATWLVAALSCLAWLPFLGRAASPDEGGYLQVATQWSPGGSSLYGNYWVDRPPLLIAIHAFAGALGGIVPLRLFGVAAVVVSVLLTARLVRIATGAGATQPATAWSVAPLVVAGCFLSTPLFGTTQVDGELLSVPFVLAGLVAALQAIHLVDVRAARWWGLAAGASAVAAMMVKQNAVDVFFVVAVLVAAGRRDELRPAARRLACCFTIGALGTAVGVLSAAAAWGTSPAGLWDAVVTFRFEAASVIARSATSSTSDRMVLLVESVAASMAPIVAGVMIGRLRRPLRGPLGVGPKLVDLRWAAVALLMWEVVSIAGGGSYWLHYLLVLVPGMILLTVAAAQRSAAASRLLASALGLVVVSAVVAVVVAAVQPRDSTDVAVASYLRVHARPGDGAVVAFGHPDILWDAGLQSPYDELWSLPVRVRDPRLTSFDAVLKSGAAPEWVVVDGASLGTWGVDATEADRTLDSRYHVVTEIGSYNVWEHN